jgi:hypothetical protein
LSVPLLITRSLPAARRDQWSEALPGMLQENTAWLGQRPDAPLGTTKSLKRRRPQVRLLPRVQPLQNSVVSLRCRNRPARELRRKEAASHQPGCNKPLCVQGRESCELPTRDSWFRC